MSRLSFSGHETFFCKQFWLKKGYDYIVQGNPFNSPNAVVDLGVGKNMVGSIRFWLKVFGITNDTDKPTEFGDYILGKNGKDLYLEDFGTIWLLHYHLVQLGKASIYDLVFNYFRKERVEFTRDHLHSFLKRKCLESTSKAYNENTVKKDIGVFIRNYLPPKSKKLNVEEEFSALLIDLNLMTSYKNKDSEWYKIEGQIRKEIPFHIVLFAILDKGGFDTTISFNDLLISENSPGQIFALNSEGLYLKLIEITKHYSEISYTETAGNRVLQFSEKPNKFDILNEYYN